MSFSPGSMLGAEEVETYCQFSPFFLLLLGKEWLTWEKGKWWEFGSSLTLVWSKPAHQESQEERPRNWGGPCSLLVAGCVVAWLIPAPGSWGARGYHPRTEQALWQWLAQELSEAGRLRRLWSLLSSTWAGPGRPSLTCLGREEHRASYEEDSEMSSGVENLNQKLRQEYN